MSECNMLQQCRSFLFGPREEKMTDGLAQYTRRRARTMVSLQVLPVAKDKIFFGCDIEPAHAALDHTKIFGELNNTHVMPSKHGW